MATLDEIFAAMPDPAAAGTHELLIIDPDGREIYVPDSEKLFGVEHDGNAETKYFQCPRYVGNGIDLAACFLRINFQNANGERDGYLVKDTAVNGEHIYFSWELWPKVTQYKGTVQFILCASLPGSTKSNDWHTTLAQGEVLEGLEPDAEAAAAATADVIAQLLATVAAQEANVEAVGAEQVQTVQAAAKAAQEAAVAEVEAKKQNVLAQLPADYTAMGQQVDKLTRSTAGAIVCQAEGTTVQVHDASDHPLHGLRIFGRSTQDGTPTPDNPVEIVSTPAPVVTITDGTEDNVQTLAITTTASLPGIPVTSGGNYTDADGQQWICDEVDLGRGVYVQRIGKKEYDGAEDESWSVTARWYYISIHDKRNNRIEVENALMCDRFMVAPNVNQLTGYISETYFETGNVNILVNFDDGAGGVDNFKTWLQSNKMTVRYVLKTPVETHLSEVELAAFAALHSVKPTTTILNDSGAHMAAEYVADTKLYIDSKLAELVAAMNA